MAKESGVAIGIEPAFAGLTALSDRTPELIRRYINTQIEHLRVFGYDAVSCLVDLRETADEAFDAVFRSRRFDCVVVGT